MRRNRRSSYARITMAAVAMYAALVLSACGTPAASAPPASTATSTPFAPPTRTPQPGGKPVPILAYYYIWFNVTSWDKNKIDYPQLGHYSSDDTAVIDQHIQWAKAAGIDGFIVSWKNTPRLNEPLDRLIRSAREHNFKLAINYEGLDQQRDPLPASQVAADLDYFIANYGKDPVFDIYGKPMVIWAGTWKFSTEEIAGVTASRRDRLLILASDRDAKGVQRLNGLVDGDAYYFSSVNPDTFPNYQGKLNAMADAVHAAGGLWIAPAAPGFDARLIGGTTVVDRKDGQTLTIEMNAARNSSPDAIGLISWNEFTENSHIEPSAKFGRRYLDVLTSIDNARVPDVNGMDSSDPGSGPQSFGTEGLALGMIVALVLGSVVAIARRQ